MSSQKERVPHPRIVANEVFLANPSGRREVQVIFPVSTISYPQAVVKDSVFPRGRYGLKLF